MLPSDTVLNQRYRLDEVVGEGGMAAVYRGADTRLGRTVAIKVLHTQFTRDQPFLQRFQQEAEFAASLGAHPNIVDIYDIGQDDTHEYIVMEFIEGRSLKELIQDRAPFAVPEAFAIGQQVASALDFAHKRGLIHRDVKPQNIMVTTDGIAKVTDFGIARSTSASQLTRTGMVIGTVHYFSPEQAQGKPALPASDIYSLGVILYEMLTGHLPFDAETPIGVAMQHLHSQPPSPWEYNPALPARAVGTVLRALEKDPSLRYRDAAEFASALASAPAAVADIGMTTINPIADTPVRQYTAQFEPVAVTPVPVRTRRVARAESAPQQPPNQWRTAWIALAALLIALIVGVSAFVITRNSFGGSATSTATATETPTIKPTPRKKATPKPTVAVAPATSPPTFVPVTATPFPPTFTPVPPTRVAFTPTSTPKPLPTAVPPTASPIPFLPGGTPTPTGVG